MNKDKIKINNYKVFLDIDLTKLLYRGIVLISFNTLEEINLIEINSEDFTINSLKINENNFPWESNDIKDILTIKNESGFKPNTNYLIEINFDWKKISAETDGFYYTQKNNKILCTTHLEPISARKFIPCFDYPNLKANFTLVVKIDSKYNCLSNTSIKKVNQDKTTNHKIIYFNTTPLMSTYLLCLVCGEIKPVLSEPIKSKSGILVNGYSIQDDIKYMGWSVKKTVEALDYFESWFGIKYSLDKLDIVSVPNFSSGAIENWGIITFREEYILSYNQNNYLSKIKILEVIYHEVAHQWFGNLVTLSNWGDLWLNEATATYFSWMALLSLYDKYNSKEFYWLLESKSVYLIDAYTNTHPIIMDDIQELNPSELFDEITYSKGNMIINYVANLLGLKSFRMAINKYLNEYLFSNPLSGDKLFEYFNEYSPNKNIDYVDLMKKLTITKGYPILYVGYNDSKFDITYKTFNLNKNLVSEYPVNLFLKIKNNEQIDIIDLDFNKSNKYKPSQSQSACIFNPNNELFCICYYDNFQPNIKLMNQVELIKYSHDEYILGLYGYTNINKYLNSIKNIFESIDINTNTLLYNSILSDIINLMNIFNYLNLDNTKIIKFINTNLNNNIINLCWDTISTSNNFSEFILDNILILETIKLKNNNLIEMVKKIYDYQNNLILDSPNYYNNYYLSKTIFSVIIKYYQDSEIDNILNILTTCNNALIIDTIIGCFSLLNDKNFDIIFKKYHNLIKSQDYSLFFNSISKVISKQEFIIDYWICYNSKISTINEITFKILLNISKNIYNLKLINKLLNYLEKNINNNNKLIVNKIKDILTTNKIVSLNIQHYLL